MLVFLQKELENLLLFDSSLKLSEGCFVHLLLRQFCGLLRAEDCGGWDWRIIPTGELYFSRLRVNRAGFN